ncbi:SDR family oxidoreductase [Aurantimonas sp. 22II-16-19i]|uniref:SDR family NAD(P)-dependent oxidoreductase n=1 Tax=Aurantimonas sp. 22II-16-19i TaxID=1317114 RepID=UPI0009F7F039|nr:SDR family oxidoreductase [Aurantimonas sp. 22II-16-19i]ORE88038.1 Levodione reductase [Aurantimonas sp. 22II-16-19i]
MNAGDPLRHRPLENRLALITGAAGAIGAATAALLAQRGARIVAVDRPGTDFAALEKALGGDLAVIEADVTDEASVRAYVAQALTVTGTIDVFFNNAGIGGPVARIADYALEDFRRVMAVNVEGVFLGLKHVLPVMQARGSGSIVNAASASGVTGSPGMWGYNASKHAVVGLTRVAATEAAPHGVRVNCIAPGPIRSKMMGRLDDAIGSEEAKRARGIPARRYGLVSEVAGVVAFLASDDSTYVNGAVHAIDGGLTAI